MTRLNNVNVLHRAFERVSAGAAAIALTFLALLSVDARAAETLDTPPSVTVRYSETAIGNAKGAADVYRRLKAAARQVCGVNFGRETLERRVAARDCYDIALAEAVRKIDRPTLTALHTANARNFG